MKTKETLNDIKGEFIRSPKMDQLNSNEAEEPLKNKRKAGPQTTKNPDVKVLLSNYWMEGKQKPKSEKRKTRMRGEIFKIGVRDEN